MNAPFFLAFFSVAISSTFSGTSSPDQTLLERNLIKDDPTSQEILENYEKYILGPNKVKNGVLGVISDNEDSYKNATVYVRKFNYLTPSWFNIQRTGSKQYKVTGIEKVKRKWIEELIGKHSGIRIVPRMSFDGWTSRDFLMLATSEFEWISLSQELLSVCETYHIHGLNLDLFDSWYGKVPDTLLIGVLQEISARLRINLYVSTLIIPPKFTDVRYVNNEIFENLAEYFSGIVLMTSEYPSVASIEDYIKDIAPKETYRNKILFGIEFDGYTNDYKKVTKNEYIKYLRDLNEENSFEKKQRIFYPTLQYVYERVNLANALGTGISILNVGDGLDYFYELL